MNPADMKREILQSSESTGIRKKLISGETGLSSEDVIEQGNAFESLVQHKGWSYIEARLMNNINLNNLLFGKEDPIAKGIAQASVLLIQWVQQTILAKNEILKKINEQKYK